MKDKLDKIFFNEKLPLDLRLLLVWLLDPVYLIIMGIWLVLVVYNIIFRPLWRRSLLLYFIQWSFLTICYQVFFNAFYNKIPIVTAIEDSRFAKHEAIKNAYASSNKANNTPEK